MYVYIFFVIYILFDPFIWASIHRYVNYSHGIKVLIKVIKTETFNVDLHQNKFIWFGLFCFSNFFISLSLSLNIYIYIYIPTDPCRVELSSDGSKCQGSSNELRSR